MTESIEMKALHGQLKVTNRDELEPMSPDLSNAEPVPGQTPKNMETIYTKFNFCSF